MSTLPQGAAPPANPAPSTGPSFSSLPRPPATLTNLQRLGYERRTPIRAASLSLALAGKDLIAQAKIGNCNSRLCAAAAGQPDGRVLISIEGYRQWVEQGRV